MPPPPLSNTSLAGAPGCASPLPCPSAPPSCGGRRLHPPPPPPPVPPRPAAPCPRELGRHARPSTSLFTGPRAVRSAASHGAFGWSAPVLPCNITAAGAGPAVGGPPTICRRRLAVGAGPWGVCGQGAPPELYVLAGARPFSFPPAPQIAVTVAVGRAAAQYPGLRLLYARRRSPPPPPLPPLFPMGTTADGGKGSGSEWRSANWRRPLQTTTHQRRHTNPPPPPPLTDSY